MFEKMKKLLEDEELARERSNREIAIFRLLQHDFPALAKIPYKEFKGAGAAYSHYERSWRKVTEKFPELRGKDWDEGRVLEENFISEFVKK
jgi:hypothetical protein